jgi:hypothetical protein
MNDNPTVHRRPDVTDQHHRHEWIQDRGLCELRSSYSCSSCGLTVAGCNTCDRPNESSNLICLRCLDSERAVLDHIREAWRIIGPDRVEILRLGTVDHDGRTRPPTMRHPDRVSVPFGAAPRYATDARDDFEVIQGIMRARPDRSLLDLVRDPENVMDALHEVAEDWASQRGVEASGDVLKWLGESMLWAAQTLDADDWVDYRETVRKVRFKLRHVAGLLPEKDPIPCLHCGEPDAVVQDWIDRDGRPYRTGLSDTLRCQSCGFVWDDRAHFDYLNLTTVRAAPETHPNARVTLAEARAALPRARRGTINEVIRRDRQRPPERRRIPEVGRTRAGEPLYRLGDVARVANRTEQTA